jgi:NAD(P) transhydrogenase subunit alpha
MNVGVLKESRNGETRVALVPDLVAKLKDKGYETYVESGAGLASGLTDEAYKDAGATVLPDSTSVYGKADVLLRVQVPTMDELDKLRDGTSLLAHLWPLQNHDLVQKLADKKITSFSMDMVPRITRAQAMDSLSAMSTVSGYKAVLLAAAELGKFCPMLMTAAGTIRPSRALILGAGVAGLTAIGTCRRLGCIVEAFDVRPAVKEQVESLGAKFVEFTVDDSEDKGGYAKALDDDQQAKQLELIHKHIAECDIVIYTALIPGRKAPILVTEAMLKDMRDGSVVIDLAASQGGNCEGVEADKTVTKHGIKLIGPTNLPATVPVHASQMYSKVMSNLLFELSGDEGIQVDTENEVTVGCMITNNGDVANARVRSAMGLPELAAPEAADPEPETGSEPAPSASA